MQGTLFFRHLVIFLNFHIVVLSNSVTKVGSSIKMKRKHVQKSLQPFFKTKQIILFEKSIKNNTKSGGLSVTQVYRFGPSDNISTATPMADESISG